MTKHGCFFPVSSEVKNLRENATRQKPLGLLINVVRLQPLIVLLFILSTLVAGCAIGGARSGTRGAQAEQRLSKEEILERRLRRAQAEIETLRERNLILKSRIKMISRHSGVEALQPKEELQGFDSGMVFDVPIDSRRQPSPSAPRAGSSINSSVGREEVLNKIDLRPLVSAATREVERPKKLAVRPRRLPVKESSVAANSESAVTGEQADRALVRTIVALLKEKDFAEAIRTATLLEKSYPESSALAEAKFQIGLGYFRSRAKTAGALQKADSFFADALRQQNAHIRVKAGAQLMRGIIAKRIGLPSSDRRNLEIATRNFEYVISKFPKTSEARRARAELSAMNSAGKSAGKRSEK